MTKIQTRIITAAAAVAVALASIAALAGCQNPLNAPRPAAATGSYGNVIIDLGDGDAARTVFPGKTGLNYVYTFTKTGGQLQTIAPVNGNFTLEYGQWSVAVHGYAGEVSDENLAVRTEAPVAFTVSAATQTVNVTLEGIHSEGDGIFKYRIQFPNNIPGLAANHSVGDESVYLYQLPNLSSYSNISGQRSNNAGVYMYYGATAVPAGFYLLRVRLRVYDPSVGWTNIYAGRNEVVHIYNGMTTEYGTQAAPIVIDAAEFTAVNVVTGGPDPTPLTEGVWTAGINRTADGQWYSFTATAATQYVHISFDTFTSGYLSLYNSSGGSVGDTYVSGSTTSGNWTVTSGQTYYVRVSNGIGSYYVTFNQASAAPTAPALTIPTTGLTALTANTWANGETAIGDDKWYTFSVTSGDNYWVWWNERGSNGNGEKTGDIKVSAYYANGTAVTNWTNPVSYAWATNPKTFTASATGTVYLRAVYENAEGTFGIAYNTANTMPAAPVTLPTTGLTALTANTWANGEITTAALTEKKWYTFNVTSGSSYWVWWNERGSYGNGEKTGDVKVSAFYADGNAVENWATAQSYGWAASPRTFTASATGTVYLRLEIEYESNSYAGTFGIAYNTANTMPAAPVTLPTTGLTGLTANTWTNGEITTAALTEKKWYTFNVTSGSSYWVWWNEVAGGGNGEKTGNVKVSAFYANGNAVENWESARDSSWSSPISFTASATGTVYLRLELYSQSTSYAGTYAIAYNTANTRPASSFYASLTPVALTNGTWRTDTIINAGVWYSFTATSGTTYYIWSKDGYYDNSTYTYTAGYVYSGEGNYITSFQGNYYSSPRSFTASSSGTVYIKVTNQGTSGQAAIVYSTTNTRPAE